MKTVSLLVVGLLCLSVVVYAGEVITNDTGEDATGLRVMFSTPVLITAFGDILTSVDPQVLSFEFVFSGGVVKPWESHWMNWAPATASIMEYEWLTTSAMVSSAANNEVAIPSPPEGREAIVEDLIEIVVTGDLGEKLTLSVLRRMSDRSLPFFVEYMVEDAADCVEVSWDFSQLEDSDFDGQFRNDRDGDGLEAWHIYNTNRTPFIVTIQATDVEGTVYKGEDEIAFNIQNGDVIALDSRRLNPSAIPGAWATILGDPDDDNLMIANPTAAVTQMQAMYPTGTSGVSWTREGKTQSSFRSDVWVFNKDADLMEIRAVGEARISQPHVGLEYIGAFLDEIVSRGFTWVKYSSAWPFTYQDGTLQIYPPLSQSQLPAKVETAIRAAHDRGLSVSFAPQIVWPDEPQLPRWQVPPSDNFFWGDGAYYDYISRFFEAAVASRLDSFELVTELGRLMWADGEPYLRELIEKARYDLAQIQVDLDRASPGDNSNGRDSHEIELTCANLLFGCTLDSCRPHPYLDSYGWPFELSLEYGYPIGFSSYRAIAPSCDAGIREMEEGFRTEQLDALERVHSKWGTDVWIAEWGTPNVDCGASSFGIGTNMDIQSAPVDSEESRRATAAALRAIYDFLREGNTYLMGIAFWEWILDTDEGLVYWTDKGFRINWLPELEEITAFFLDAPAHIRPMPVYVDFRGRIYFDPHMDVRAIRELPEDAEVVQAFEGLGRIGSHDPFVHGSYQGYFDTGTKASFYMTQEAPFAGENSLAIEYVNQVGRGGEAVVVPWVRVSSWQEVDTISLAVRRDNVNVGLGLILWDGSENSSYTQRVPLQDVDEWELIALHISAFSKILGDAPLLVNENSSLDPEIIGLYLYSLDGLPTSGTVWIDNIAVRWRHSPGPEDVAKTLPVVDPEGTTRHSPITIRGDVGFTEPGSGVVAGTGTLDDPYIIEGWFIEADQASVWIEETTRHFVIRNCHLVGGSNGLVLMNVQNATIKDCTVTSTSQEETSEDCRAHSICGDAVAIMNSSNVVFEGNEILDASVSGLSLHGSNACTIADNEIRGSWAEGVSVGRGSNNNVIIGNQLSGNARGSIEWYNPGICDDCCGNLLENNVFDSHDLRHLDDQSLSNPLCTDYVADPNPPQCKAMELSAIDWLASLNDDDTPVGVDNHAEIIDGSDDDGNYFGMAWKSPEWTDLSLNGLGQFDRSSATTLSLTLAALKPMNVSVEITLDLDFCGLSWRNAIIAQPLSVDVAPNEFFIPYTAFSKSPPGSCREPLPEDALENLISVVLLPDASQGELRVYDVGVCDMPIDEAEALFGLEEEVAYILPEIAGLEAVGNPLRDRYSDEEELALARSIWDLQAWQGRLYLGSGNSGNSGPAANAGPVDIWYYDPFADAFVNEFTVDDEQIARYCVLSDGLYIPGHDARESWDFGNIYVNRGDGWIKSRTLPNAIHVYDIAEWDDQLVAVGHNLREVDDGYSGGGGFYVSSDGGTTWAADFTPCTQYSAAVDYDPTRPDVVRVTELFEFNGTLYASGWLMPRIYVFLDGRFEYLDVNPFPGSVDPSGLPCTSLPDTAAGFVTTTYEDTNWYAVVEENDPCVSARVTQNVTFYDELVYIGGTMGANHDWKSFGLFAATEMQDGGMRRLILPDASEQLRDLLVVGDLLYLLAFSETEDGFHNRIYSTADLANWDIVREFLADASVSSMEYLDGWLYVGLGGETPASGNLYRFEL